MTNAPVGVFWESRFWSVAGIFLARVKVVLCVIWTLICESEKIQTERVCVCGKRFSMLDE